MTKNEGTSWPQLANAVIEEAQLAIKTLQCVHN